MKSVSSFLSTPVLPIVLLLLFSYATTVIAGDQPKAKVETQIVYLAKDSIEICFSKKHDDSCVSVTIGDIETAFSSNGLQPLAIYYLADNTTMYEVDQLNIYDEKNDKEISMHLEGNVFSKDTYLLFSPRTIVCTDLLENIYDCYLVTSKALLQSSIDNAVKMKEKRQLAELDRESQNSFDNASNSGLKMEAKTGLMIPVK